MTETLDPKPIEYFLTYDVHAGVAYEDSPVIPKGTIVVDVRLRSDRANLSVYFGMPDILYKIKETGQECVTHYNNALAENTPENWALLTEADRVYSQIKTLEEKRSTILDKMTTLKGNKQTQETL